MKEQYLRKQEIAAMFNTNWNRAASILRENGVYPVDFGRGRSNGLRWLESAVNQVMRTLHAKAQPAQPIPSDYGKKKPLPRIKRGISLADMSVSSIHQLVSDHQIH